jgi:hypothetical protein
MKSSLEVMVRSIHRGGSFLQRGLAVPLTDPDGAPIRIGVVLPVLEQVVLEAG